MRISHKNMRLVVIAGLALAVGCAALPIHNRILQAGLGLGCALVWGGAWVMLAGRTKSRRLLLVLPWLVLIPFVLPGKPIDPDALRTDYVSRLQGYDGTRYVWGGESPSGIDCSGLPRRALRDALWAVGMSHANGAAFRMWLDQWWFDASALAMSQGDRGRTRALGIAGPLCDLASSPVLPGDLAVRGDGGHVVVYLGGHQWIEADPSWGKVHCWVSLPGDGARFEMHRWVACERTGR